MNNVNRDGARGTVDAVLRAYLDLTRRIVIAVSCGFFAFMVAINGLEIIGRAFFSISFSWVQEVSILSAMWIYFFAYALIAKNEEYIRVDFAAQLMPEPWQRATEYFRAAGHNPVPRTGRLVRGRDLSLSRPVHDQCPDLARVAVCPAAADRCDRYPHHRIDLLLLANHRPLAATPASLAGRGGVAAWRRR